MHPASGAQPLAALRRRRIARSDPGIPVIRRTDSNCRGAARLRLLASLLCLLGAGSCAHPHPEPTAVDGRLDLTSWDFEADGDVALLGTWQICWGELLRPDEPCDAGWRTVPVRGLWTEESARSPIGGRGVATYRLRIAMPPGQEGLSLVAGGPLTAYRLFIDGIERGGVGVVGRTAETTTMGVRNRVYDLPDRSPRVELLVQVANFEFRSGGLRRIWFVGTHDSIQGGIGRAILREGMVFSVGVVVGLGYLLLFALGRSDRARGYFGLASLVLGLRAVPASISSFGELMAPWAGFELLTRLEYLGTAIAVFAGAGYARTKVEGVTPPLTMKGIQLVALALAAIEAFAPFPIVLATLPLQYILPVLVLGLLIGCYGWAWIHGVSGVRVTATAGLLYLGAVLHDIARTLQSGVGAPVELYPYAMVLWIAAEGAELMNRFYRTFAKVESLSDELAEANFELQETEAAIVRFVPFDFLRLLGKQSIRDVGTGDRVRARISVLHCGFYWRGDDYGRRGAASDFDAVHALVSRVEPLIAHRGGFVNEFELEGFQAFFPSGAAAAVSAALEIVEAVRRASDDAAASGLAVIDVAIGIDTGAVLLGTMGSSEHLLRGVVGEPVANARRIEALAARHGAHVLISPTTRSELGGSGDYTIRPVEGASLTTAQGPVPLHEVRGSAS
jgi:class 3 adenylate cyclase